MRIRKGLVLTAGLLVTGMVIGLAWSNGSFTRPVEARNLTTAEAVQLSRELQATDRSLISGNTELAKVVRLMRPSVVHIESRRTTNRGGTIEETGSGVIVTLPGVSGLYVVTNRHVVADNSRMENISIRLDDGRFINPKQVLQDKATDVAVLKLPDIDAVPARWGDSDRLEIGHLVMALGSPFGLSQSVSLGIVSAKGRRSLALGTAGEMLNQDFLQTDAAINPGNSGGPLVDLHGRVIGINTAIASNSGGNEGIAFSVPSQLARRVAEALVKFGRVPRAYLGVKLDPEFNAEAARRYQLDRLRGTRVVQVYEKTPAARAALQADDVILEFNGMPVDDQNHLINYVSLTPIGKTIRLGVLRDGRKITVDVVLADRRELDGAANPQTQQQQRTSPYRPSSGTREISDSSPETGGWGRRAKDAIWGEDVIASPPAVRDTPPAGGGALEQRPENHDFRGPTPATPPGLRLHPITPSLAGQIGMGGLKGGLVVLETPTDGGWLSELKPYDVLVEAARHPLVTVADWEDICLDHVGSELIVKVRRVEGESVREFLLIRPGVNQSAEREEPLRTSAVENGVFL